MNLQHHAEHIIDELDGLPLNEQIACLVGCLFSHIMASAPDHGVSIVKQVADNLPKQYHEAMIMSRLN